MKKLFSFLLTVAVVMSMAAIAMSVSAEETEISAAGATDVVDEVAANDAGTQVGAGADVATSGDAGKVSFIKPEKWSGKQVFCHIYDSDSSFYDWQQKAEKCTDEGGGKWSFDLSKLTASSYKPEGLVAGHDYSLLFSDNTGNESCSLTFNTNVVGDTFKVTDTDAPTLENPADSNKKQWKGSWTTNAKKYGIPLMITSVGTIQGDFIAKDGSVGDIIAAWDKDYDIYPNEQSYSQQSSARDHKTRLKEITEELNKRAAAGEFLIVGGGVYQPKSNDSSGSSSKSDSSSSKSGSSSSSASSSSNGNGSSSFKTADGKTVTKDANGNYVDENGNVVDASDVVETTGTVATGESTTYVYVTFGVMLAAAGVYFLTRKRKA